jgi:serine/threonine-protein phosphatase 2A regulatory subunit B''
LHSHHHLLTILTILIIFFSFYDSGGYGYLREEDLENYIFELIPTLPHLSSLGTEFYPFYVCTAVRKFFFFLDPSRKGKIQIKELLTSPMLAELFDLRAADLTEGDLQFNWFSATSAQRVYGQYLQLDVDRNGMLSRAEIAGIGDGTLTDIVLDRLFEETHTYAGEMDYKSFLDLALAMDNKKSIRGLEYFWRLLDVNHRGYITVQQISLFYRDVQKKMVAAFHEPANVADVIDEIFDMVKPLDPYKITFKDLIRCGCGDTIVSILTDVRGFYNYENRESFK